MHYPGQVHFIPRDADEDEDRKVRRHALLTKGDNAATSAANVLVNPTATTHRRTEFDRPKGP
jgi:hypothetical protein